MAEYILNGQQITVDPEHEELFKKTNPEAALASEKSILETDPSQNNQQLKVDEDVSIDMTTGEVISKKQSKKKKEISLELQNEELNEIDNREIYNFEANDPDFFGSKPQDAIEKLKHIFGEGDESIFEYNSVGGNKIEILHKHSGKSTIIDLDIGLDHYQKKFGGEITAAKIYGLTLSLKDQEKIRDNAIKENSDKLFNFFDETLEEWEHDKIKTNQESLIKDYELRQAPGGPLHVNNVEKQKVKDKYYGKQYILDGKVVYVDPENTKAFEKVNHTAKEVNMFDPRVERKALPSGPMGVVMVDETIQPYKKELEQAKQSLIKSGVENPTRKQIEDVARNILVGKEIDALYDDKFNKYMNSDEVEGKGGIINKIKIAAQLSTNKQAKELIELNTKRKAKIKDIEDSVELKKLEEYHRIFSDKQTKINISEYEENVKLENGKIVPKSMFDDYNRNQAIVRSKYESLNKWLEDNNDKIEKLETSDYKNDLIQRNYNDLEKAQHNISSGFERIAVGAGYFTVKAIQSRVGFKEIGAKPIDQVKLDYDMAAQIYHNEYQKDVKFGTGPNGAFNSAFNFGKFVAQEMGQQLPIFATLAVPYIGIPALGLSSAGDNWSDMVREDKETGLNTSTLKKFWTSAGYGTAEVIFDRWITRANMYMSFRGLTRGIKGNKKLIDEGWAGVKHFAKYNTFKNLVYVPASELASESFTTITQNVLRGRPITENLGHAAFSGGMFGGLFGGAPFIKGLVMNKLSTNKEIREWDSMNEEMADIQQQLLWADEINLDPKIRKSLEDRLSDLKAKSVSMFDAMEKDIGELSEDAVRAIFLHRANAEELRRKARELEADNTVDSDTKRKLIQEWTKEYNRTLAQIDYIKDPINRTAFRVFTISDEENDKKRRESLFQKAFNSLVSGDSYSNKRKIILDPSDKQIAEEARLIFNTEEIYKDYKNKTKTKLGGGLKLWSTVEKAIFEIEKMDNISDETKAELIKSLQEELVHGSNIPTIDPKTGKSTGKYIPFQIVENMAKDDRLETKTHELGHMVLGEAISFNPEAFRGIAEQILEHTRVTNPRLYNKLKTISLMLPIDEVLTNYMEFIVDESVNFNDSKNRGLASMIAWMFGEGVKKATNSDIEYSFRGETDAINFITQLAKKIKNGTLTIKDIRDIKESPVGKKAEKEGKEAEKEKGKQTPTSKFSKFIDAKPYVDELTFNEKTGKTYTEEEWGYYEKDADGKFILDKNKKRIWNEGEGGAKRAIEEIKKKRKVLEGEGYLDRLIAAKYKVKPVPQSWVDDVIGSKFFINHVRSFNPEVNNSLFGWINSQIRNKAGSVFNKNEQGKLPKGTKIRELDAKTPEGQKVQLEDTTYDLDKITDRINYWDKAITLKDSKQMDRRSKFRRNIGLLSKDASKAEMQKSEIFRKVQVALSGINLNKFGNKKEFLAVYNKIMADALESTMGMQFADNADFKKYRNDILAEIPLATLIQWQKQLPAKDNNGKDFGNIFVKLHPRKSNQDFLSDFMNGTNLTGKNPKNKKLLPDLKALYDAGNVANLDKKDAIKNPEGKEYYRRKDAGIRMRERLDIKTEQWDSYVDGNFRGKKQTVDKSGTKGNNKTKILRESAVAIAKDATPEALTNEFLEKFIGMKKAEGIFNTKDIKDFILETIQKPANLKFSKSIKMVNDIIAQVDPNFEQNGISHIDKILETFIDDGMYRHKTKGEIDKFFYDVENVLIPNLPADLVTRTVIRPSNRIFGANRGEDIIIVDGKEITINDYYNEKRANIFEDVKGGRYLTPEQRIAKNLKPLRVGKNFTGKGENYKYGVTYGKMFGTTEAEILKSEKDGTVKRINEMHQSMHRQLWQRIHKSLQQDPNNAKIWGSYLSLVGQDTEHPHRMGAEYVGHSINPKGHKGKIYEWEHSMQATRSYLYLLHSSLGGYNFDASYELVMKNFKLIALDNYDNQKLNNANRGKSMGPNWDLLSDSWLDRYFHPDVTKIRDGIDPKKLKHINGKTFAKEYNINSDGKPATIKYSKSQIDNTFNAIEAFNKQAKLIKKINKEIQADLEKRGYTFVEKIKFSKGQTPAEQIKILENDLKKRGYEFVKKGQTAAEQIKILEDDLKKRGYTFIEKPKYSKKGQTASEMIEIMQADLEAKGYTFVDMDNKGMSTFDFDETLIIDGENFVVATDPNTGEKINIKSGDWPIKGPELAEQGYEFNFDDFVNVRGGVSGPLLQKMKNQIKKYGPENVFVLTARPQSADTAIHEWLKSKGINIPFKNITGLANSTGQAKADWMLNKFAEGYNDMYFVDDALPNVKAVKDVLEQLDIKSKVVQAKIKFSKKITLDFDKILEQSKGMQAGKKFSAAEARKRGIGKGKMRFFVPPSAEDFKGLIYSFLGKGREGDAHAAWFKENLFDPFAKGIRDWNSYKQAMSNDYNELKKQFPKVGKILNKKVKGTSFTNDAAIRVYLWNKAGFEIPGISKALQDKLVKHVESNPELKQFAEGLSVISRVAEGYMKPSDHWVAESIASDLANTVLKLGRKQFLAEWIENKNNIFSKENLNKIEAIYGTGFREALENILYRMETGRNRTTGKDSTVNRFLDWINGSVGAVMFFNIRSAALQTISTINFINWGDNNVFKAATAFANQVQFWKDFAFIFNSDMLKQRRAGLQIDVSASELTKAFHDGRSTPQAVIAYLLEKGFLPTQIADSFAIAMGGATFYRNRLKTYLKQGMSEAKAKEQAWLDFQEIAEETQQSSRPDLISMQQAGVLGRIILAWQNTPMQMTRLTKKALSDLVNRRRRAGMGQFQSDTSNISRIMYYGLIQNLWFGALQSGLMFMLFGWDEDEERKKKLEIRVANGALDTLLRGTGVYGAAISTLKNVILKWREESQKGWNRDDLKIAQEAISLSPPLGSKLRKIMNAVRTEKYNKGVSEKIGMRIENPNLSIAVNLTEALTNIPVARLVNKANNVEEALSGNHDIWQRVALVSGWNRWDVGVKDEELEQAKKEAKEERRIKKKQEKAKEKKAKQKKKVRCVRIKSNGERCKNRTDKKNKRCYAHQ